MRVQIHRKRLATALCASDKQEIRASPAIGQLKAWIIYDTKAIDSPPSIIKDQGEDFLAS